MLKLLVLSTPIGPLGSGLGGGVEITLRNIAHELLRRNYTLQIIAPQGSRGTGIAIVEIPGTLQVSAQTQKREDSFPLPANSVLANMWDYARQVQAEYDLILNLAYDWLPLYLTPFFACPIAHLISMGSLTDVMDDGIHRVITQFPGTIAVHGVAQAKTFSCADQLYVIGNAVDLSRYEFCTNPQSQLAWVGRIAPEKGLEDAVAAVKMTGISLKIMGLKQCEDYWQKICQDYPGAPIDYLGFLPTAEMQGILRQCRAVLLTPKWNEPFPNVALESLACGVPLLAYDRGGMAEIVREGITGWLVAPDSISGLVAAIEKIDCLNRNACRQQAEAEYGLRAMGDRLEQWFYRILHQRS